MSITQFLPLPLAPSNDLEIELGQLVEKYSKMGIDYVIDALDFVVTQLENKRDDQERLLSPLENSK